MWANESLVSLRMSVNLDLICPLVSCLLGDTINPVHAGRVGLGYAAIAGRGHSTCRGMQGRNSVPLGEKGSKSTWT